MDTFNQLSKKYNGNKTLVLLTVCLGSILVTSNNGILNIAIPTLVDVFETSLPTASWIITSLMISMSLFVVHAGKVSDIFGRKKTFIVGLVIFLLASFFAGFASTVQGLIIARIFQGIGGAIILANSMSIVTDIFPAKQRGAKLGIVAMSIAIGMVTGPLIGGFILLFSWNWIFWFNVPFIMVILALTIISLPKSERSPEKHKFDIYGTLTLLTFLIAILFMFTYALPNNFGWNYVLLISSIAAISLLVFILVERKFEDPIIQIDLFKNKTYSIANICSFTNALAQSFAIFVLIIYLQVIKGFSPFEASLIIIPIALMLAITGPIMGKISDNMGSKWLTSGGFMIMAVGLGFLSFITADTSIVYILITSTIVGLGSGIFLPPNNRTIMNIAPPEHRGVVAATRTILNMMARLMSVALTVGILGVVLPAEGMNLPTESFDEFIVLVQYIFWGCTIICFFSGLLTLQRGMRKIVPEDDKEAMTKNKS